MKSGIKILAAAAAAAALLLSAGCSVQTSGSGTASSDGKPIIAVSIVPEATFAGAVCGDLADIVTIVPPGSSPETYEPTPQEMAQFSQAEAYFAIGVPVEDSQVLPKAEGISTMKIVKLQDAVSKTYPDRTFQDGERDPHIWLSPKRVKVMVQAIADEMASLDPANSAQYSANAQDYMKKLDSLDSRVSSILADAKDKSILVFHPAFGYMAEDYGLNMVALQEEGKEATASHLEQMVDFAKQKGITTVFYQEEVDSKQTQAFAEEIGGQAVQLTPLAANYEDNMVQMAEAMAAAAK